MSGLADKRILVTRPAHQAENLSALISLQGGYPIRFPTLEIIDVAETNQISNVLANLTNFQWLIFISVNAVNFALKANGGKIPKLTSLRIAAIGRATAQALEFADVNVDMLPEQGFDSEALLASLAFQELTGQRILIVRGEGGREELASILHSRGAEVNYLNVYRRFVPNIDNTELLMLLAQQRLDAITITSGEALQNLLVMVAPEYHDLLLAIPVIVVSNRIAQIADYLGFKQITVAAQPADTAIIEAVTMCLTGK